MLISQSCPINLADLISVSSLICAVVALLQTRRIYHLEARYHRPALEIDHVRLNTLEISRIKKDGNLCFSGLEKRQRYGVREADKQSSPFWFDLEIELFLNNGIALKNMEIVSVTFSFPNSDSEGKYVLNLSGTSCAAVIRSFERKMVKDRARYILLWSLNPVVLEQFNRKEAFEDAFSQFVYYSESMDSRYLYMNLDIDFQMQYEYDDEDSANCKVKTTFVAEPINDIKDTKKDTDNTKDTCASDKNGTKEQNRHIVPMQTANGFITYEA